MTGPVDITGWTMREAAHYNGGGEWFGYGHRCVQEPRLYRMDRYQRRDRSVRKTYSVDGVEVADLYAARLALASPPEVTAEEWATLEQIGMTLGPLPNTIPLLDALRLRHKGWIVSGGRGLYARRPAFQTVCGWCS